MSGDPLADLICDASAAWSGPPKRSPAAATYIAAAVRAWIVEQIDHERCYWDLTDAAPLDDLQDRIEDGAP